MVLEIDSINAQHNFSLQIFSTFIGISLFSLRIRLLYFTLVIKIKETYYTNNVKIVINDFILDYGRNEVCFF